MRIDLGSDERPSGVRDLLLLAQYLEEKEEKLKHRDKDKDHRDKRTSSRGGGDILGTALMLTLLQVLVGPFMLWAWTYAMISMKENLLTLIK